MQNKGIVASELQNKYKVWYLDLFLLYVATYITNKAASVKVSHENIYIF